MWLHDFYSHYCTPVHLLAVIVKYKDGVINNVN